MPSSPVPPPDAAQALSVWEALVTLGPKKQSELFAPGGKTRGKRLLAILKRHHMVSYSYPRVEGSLDPIYSARVDPHSQRGIAELRRIADGTVDEEDETVCHCGKDKYFDRGEGMWYCEDDWSHG